MRMNDETHKFATQVLCVMRSHRSRRPYQDQDLPDGLLENIVDAAR